MLRRCALSRSNSLHSPQIPFVKLSQELTKLHQQHKIILEKDRGGSSRDARSIEHEFRRSLDEYRAVFTMASQLAAAKLYAGRILSALHHFGMDDDPLVRQIERVMGRHALRNNAASSRNLFFKGVQLSAPGTNDLGQRMVSDLPSEVVGVPRDFDESRHSSAVAKVKAGHRGHWVLRDPDIALTKEGRRYDAW